MTESTNKLIVQRIVSLRDKNWFVTGGPAKFFCQPSTESMFVEALTFAHQKQLSSVMLGAGANILISDDGFDGLVIRSTLTHCSHIPYDNAHTLVTCGSGVSIAQAIDYALAHELLGFEEFSGIPGTIGGSVYINIHYFEHALSQLLVCARVIDVATGNVLEVDRDWFNFGYDHSTLMNKKQYLVSATFKLRRGSKLDAAYASGRQAEIIRHRISRYPNKNTCGSFFRNFHDDEVTITSNGKKMIYVAYYLDKLGVKGALSVGDAIVSYQHANMLVNRGTATSQNIIDLARTMQQMVYDQFGIIPQPECQLVGFEEYLS